MPSAIRFWLSAILLCSATSCSQPPDAPACEHLSQRISNDPVTGHIVLTPSPTCMLMLGEAECGHCTWIISGQERFLGEAHKQIPLRALVDTGKKDVNGKPLLDWAVQVDGKGATVMVSSWLNDLKPWSQVRRESIYLPAEESYAPLSTYIINQCKKSNCNEQVNAFKVKLDSLNGVSAVLPK